MVSGVTCSMNAEDEASECYVYVHPVLCKESSQDPPILTAPCTTPRDGPLTGRGLYVTLMPGRDLLCSHRDNKKGTRTLEPVVGFVGCTECACVSPVECGHDVTAACDEVNSCRSMGAKGAPDHIPEPLYVVPTMVD